MGSSCSPGFLVLFLLFVLLVHFVALFFILDLFDPPVLMVQLGLQVLFLP